MKKIYLFGMMLLSLAACHKAGQMVVSSVETPVDEIETKEAVRFGTNVLTSSGTKSVGGLDAWSGTQELYVLGFIRKSPMNYADENNYFIKNVMAHSPASGLFNSIELYNPESGEENEPFYYNATKTYDFYSYFVDDAADPSALVVQEDSVYIKCTFNGGQDLMIAKADPTYDIAKAKELATDQSVIDKITNDLEPHHEYLYSAYAARRGVHPILKFEHQLARFVFRVKVMSEEAMNANIEKITLESFSKGTLCIADENGKPAGILKVSEKVPFVLCDTTIVENDVNNVGERVALEPIESTNLGEKIAEKLEAEGKSTIAETDSTFTLGAGIMVYPDLAHKLVVETTQAGASTVNPEDLKSEYLIKPENVKTASGDPVEAFEKGKQYTVTICIYGLSEIKVYAELSQWDNTAGEIIIDPDDPSVWNN